MRINSFLLETLTPPQDKNHRLLPETSEGPNLLGLTGRVLPRPLLLPDPSSVTVKRKSSSKDEVEEKTTESP